MSASCPECARPVAVARASCLYCGATLSDAVVREAAEAPPDATAPPPSAFAPERTLIVVVTGATPAEALQAALGLSAYEAGQRARAGGPQLHRIVPAADAVAELDRLAEAGLDVVGIPEPEVRAAAPRLVEGGGWRADGLVLRGASGEIVLRPDDPFLVVRGTIVRERTPDAQIRRVALAVPEPGYRIHVHVRTEPRPVELDPGDFDFGPGGATAGSALVELLAWLARLAPSVPHDEGFRRLPVALGPAEPRRGALPDALAAGPPRRQAEQVLLDNVGQFRFYSAWRAAVERRRR